MDRAELARLGNLGSLILVIFFFLALHDVVRNVKSQLRLRFELSPLGSLALASTAAMWAFAGALGPVALAADLGVSREDLLAASYALAFLSDGFCAVSLLPHLARADDSILRLGTRSTLGQSFIL